MKSPKVRSFYFSFAILCALWTLYPGQAAAQWFDDSTHNTVVCEGSAVGSVQRDYPAATSDGNNGAIVVWEDSRAATFQIYAQHISATGVTTWKPQGVLLCKSTASQRYPIITTDNNGGAYVVWEDSRYSSALGTLYYAQHIMADGTLGYPDTGLCVAAAPGSRQSAVICDDGNGSAFLAWCDSRSAITSTQPDIYINKLWPHGMKYNDSITTNSVGAVRKPFMSTTRFNDGNAHFKSLGLGKAGSGTANVINSLSVYIVGKGKYDVESVTDDTTLTFKAGTYPPVAENYRYYFKPWVGRVVDSSNAKQLNPAICGDGNGGCYLAWQSGSVTPVGIKGMHYDSALNVKWTRGYPDSAGYLIYKGPNSVNLASGVNMSLDTATKQLIMAWEVTNLQSADTQDVYVTRMNCATPSDTSMAWSSPQSITGDQVLNQVRPIVFSDDSDFVSFNGKHTRGVMTTFRTGSLGGGPSDWDIGMVRMKGDGSSVYPQTPTAGFKVVSQPLGQIGYKAVKVDSGKILVAWGDARFSGNTPPSPDTCIYVQVIDRWGNRYFPNFKTGSTWGMPVTGHNDANGWTAKQVQLVPRASGAIAVWTDFRKGPSDPGIYAQLIMKDGSRVLPFAKTALSVQRSHSFDGSDCNAQMTADTIRDTAAATVGFTSAAVVSSKNMTVQIAPVVKGAPITFTTTVADSMQDAQGVVSVTDTVGNVSFDTISYCTIKDVSAPTITTNSYLQQDKSITFTINETRPWDRLIDSIKVVGNNNYTLTPKPTRTAVKGQPTFSFTATQTDTLSLSVICVTAYDQAGNVVSRTCDTLLAKATNTGWVASEPAYTGTVKIFPNPSTDLFTIAIDDNGQAWQCDVLDVLGRGVAHFDVRGSATFDASKLPNGSYIVRIGGKTVSIVKQ
jgi:hypothetical protein